jgi:hypothetical protein
MRGPIETSALGMTLMHEHVFVLSTGVQQNYPPSGEAVAATPEKFKATRASYLPSVASRTIRAAAWFASSLADSSIRTQRYTHASQIAAPAGPAISQFTCSSLSPQNEHSMNPSEADPPADLTVVDSRRRGSGLSRRTGSSKTVTGGSFERQAYARGASWSPEQPRGEGRLSRRGCIRSSPGGRSAALCRSASCRCAPRRHASKDRSAPCRCAPSRRA